MLNTIRQTVCAMAMLGCIGLVCPARAFELELVPVSDLGNTGDVSGFGAVRYAYWISKYEVTNSQYGEFLNAVDPDGSNTRSFYDPRMTTEPMGGIVLDLSMASGHKYASKPASENKPVVYVSFFNAMGFVDWLEATQGSAGWTYGLRGFVSDMMRNPQARWVLPSDNEWYKAAYHLPQSNGEYREFVTGRDESPLSLAPEMTPQFATHPAANYRRDDGLANGVNDGFAVSGSGQFDPQFNYLTDVGAYRNAPSPYGTFDQNGNVWEWTDTIYDTCCSADPGLRGGSWISNNSLLRANSLHHDKPGTATATIGFRVVMLPEPLSSTMLVGSGLTISWLRRWRSFTPIV